MLKSLYLLESWIENYVDPNTEGYESELRALKKEIEKQELSEANIYFESLS